MLVLLFMQERLSPPSVSANSKEMQLGRKFARSEEIPHVCSGNGAAG